MQIVAARPKRAVGGGPIRTWTADPGPAQIGDLAVGAAGWADRPVVAPRPEALSGHRRQPLPDQETLLTRVGDSPPYEFHQRLDRHEVKRLADVVDGDGGLAPFGC